MSRVYTRSTHCQRGHELSGCNEGFGTNGRYCKLCRNLKAREWRKLNHDQHMESIKRHRTTELFKATRRKNDLKRLYGLTIDDYEFLIKQQHDSCAVCRITFGTESNNKPYVDHCHTTGRVRGLLCIKCNQRIEWLVKYADEALAYLGEEN